VSSWIYIIAVIIFAIVSNVNKAQKGKNKQKPTNRGGMPTFGGGGKDVFTKRGYMQSGDDSRQGRQGSGFPSPDNLEPQAAGRSLRPRDEADYNASPDVSEPPGFPAPDYQTGEGISQEQPWEGSIAARAERMQLELNRLHDDFDQASEANELTVAGERRQRRSSAPGDALLQPQALKAPSAGLDPGQLQTGLLWAQILGPPRARKPHESFKK